MTRISWRGSRGDLPVVKKPFEEIADSAICGGCRIRAETIYGDIWEEDPQCYLSDEEIS